MTRMTRMARMTRMTRMARITESGKEGSRDVLIIRRGDQNARLPNHFPPGQGCVTRKFHHKRFINSSTVKYPIRIPPIADYPD
jgi:hypothetical protein